MDNEIVGDQIIQNNDNTETSGFTATRPSGSHEDDTKAAKDETKARRFVPFWGLVFYVMAFLGFLCSYALRVSLSVAIVAMVNHTALTEDMDTTNATNTSGTDQCPRDPELQHADGEFIWDRHQQAAALAAYYYGTIITQVRRKKPKNQEMCGPMADTFETRNCNRVIDWRHISTYLY